MIENNQEQTEVDIMGDLDDLDKAIIRRKIDGMKIVKIAKELGKNRQTIAARLSKEKVKLTIKELQKTALQILLDTQADAARELKRQLKYGETDRDKRDAAKEILKGVLSEKMELTGEAPVDVKIQFVKADLKNEE